VPAKHIRETIPGGVGHEVQDEEARERKPGSIVTNPIRRSG